MENLVFLLLIIFFTAAVVCQSFLYFINTWSKKLRCCSSLLENDRFLRMQYSIDVVSIAFLWYSISLSLTIFNKWFMQEWNGGFNFPIFITAVHMIMKFTISRIWSWSPTVEKIDPVPWSTFFLVVFPIGALTAMDIVLGNSAILFLPLTTVTTIKGSSLLFTFFWGVILGIEDFRWQLLLAVTGITAGLGIAITNSFSMNMLGFALAFGAALASGLRWALMQLLVLRDHHSKSVMVTLYRFSPASVFSILPLVFFLEADKIAESAFFSRKPLFNDACLLCAFGGVIACLLIIVEVKLVRLTSSLTMSVFGQIKEIIQIIFAMILFKENLTSKGSIGIGVSIFSSFYYRYVLLNSKESIIRGLASPPKNLKVDAEQELVLLNAVDDEEI
jgi:solute carrier family 35 protein C2